MKKFKIEVVGEWIPYIKKIFETKEEAKEYIKTLKAQDRIWGGCFEYCIKEIEIKEK